MKSSRAQIHARVYRLPDLRFEDQRLTSHALSGEENLFRILKLNPAQAIRAFYIAGGDHLHRFHPETGRPDTVRILEKGVKE